MYKKPRGSKIRKILSFLKDSAHTTAEILEMLLLHNPNRYKVTKNLLGYMEVPKFNYKEWKKQEERRLSALISKLYSQGLVKKEKTTGKILLKSTGAGFKKLKILNKEKILSIKAYKENKSEELMLIIFDIPEKFKHKRVWLRRQIKELGFELLQKSVWMGKYKIPEEFIRDLKDMKILSYIHIFQISKAGSIIDSKL